jgi:hypothetical protein
MSERERADDTQDAKTWLALACNALGRQEWDKARVAAKWAFELDPSDVDVLLCYSCLLGQYGRFWEQWELVERACRLEPENPRVQAVVGFWQLAAGDYASGWPHLLRGCVMDDTRKNYKTFFEVPVPLWNGEELARKAVVLFTDGGAGLGDCICFGRWVKRLAERARKESGKILWCCPQELKTLFGRSLAVYSDVLFLTTPSEITPCFLPRGLPYEDQFRGLTLLKSTLMHLPLHLEDTITAGSCSLITDADKVALWRERLSSNKGFKIGVSWTGQYLHARNSLRSFLIDDLVEALKDITGMTFYSLCLGGSAGGRGMVDFSSQFGSVDDTAALVSSLDLVIAADVMIAHLAGALAIPTWVLADLNTHYTWGRAGRTTPWYASVLVYRQQKFRDWTSVFEEVRRDLIELTSPTPSS